MAVGNIFDDPKINEAVKRVKQVTEELSKKKNATKGLRENKNELEILRG